MTTVRGQTGPTVATTWPYEGTEPVKTSRLLSLTVIGALAAGVLPLLAPTTVQAAPAPTVVTGGDVSSDGSSGWAVETRNTATGAFVQGTATPPLGTGSWSMRSNAIGDKKFLHLTKVDGVPLLGRPLSDLTGLSFSTFSASATYSPYVNIPIHSAFIDANQNGLADGSEPGVPAATGNAILVFEPVVASSTWVVSDTIGTPGQWRLTRPVVTGAGTTPIWTYKTYAQWTSLLTDGVINAVYGDIQWVIGDTSSAAWSGKEGWVDAITVTTTTESVTYDLEEGLGSCLVTSDSLSKTLTLRADCTTSTTLILRDGWTLDGAGYTITGVDPSPAVDFTGPVLTNELVAGGARIDVTDVHIDGNFDAGCSASLSGLKFDGAAGSFTHSTISDIKYGTGSGCQSGNSLDITNLGGPTRLSVTVDDLQVTGFQKTGIRANGNVALRLTGSSVAGAELDLVTASNSLQISRGARAYVSGNTIGGNDWDGVTQQWSATGVLLYGAADVTFTRNVVTGSDTDFGLYAASDPSYPAGRTTLTCNLFERDATIDTPFDNWNTGVAADEDLLAIVDAAGNTVRGFATPYENVVDEEGGPCTSDSVNNLALNSDVSSLTATWDAPAPMNFAPVTSYAVTLIPGGSTQTVTGTTATFSGLSAAKEYTVTVVPLNAAGSGNPAAASAPTGPGSATITSTGTTVTTATVSWSVPGNAYTSFVVTIEDADGDPVATKTTDGDARSWTFSGLDSDTDYSVTVTPKIGGTSGGADSADVTTNAAVTPPPAAPGPVSGLSLAGSATTLTATWTTAAGATTYEATLLPGGEVQTVSDPTASFTIVPGKEYTVTVVAGNASGWGPGRSASIDTALPDRPTGLSVYGATVYGELTWVPPTSPSPVLSYTLLATPTTGAAVTKTIAAAGLTFPVRVSGLARNKTYTFSVKASNAFGSGAAASQKMKGTATALTVTPKSTVYGKKVTLTGTVTDAETGKPVAGQVMYLYTKTKGSTHYVSRGPKATSAANGSFSFSYTAYSSRRSYVSSRGSLRMGASSKSTYVSMKGTATMSLNRTTVKAGTKVQFSGAARPKTGSTVELQRKEGSVWKTKKSVIPASTGAYVLTWTPKSTKDYRWRVRVSGPKFSAAVSTSKILKVT